jgi:lysophospholipase L1-like esterase
VNEAEREPAPLVFKLGVAALFCAVLLVALEGAASIARAWKDAGDAPVVLELLHSRHDPDLGWSHQPSVHVADLYGPGRSLTTNARGLRAREEYTRAVPAERYRVLCVGDSFTLGYGVDDAGTYEAELERQEPRLQAVNMGQGGYGIDQAYLWYARDGAELDHDLVVFAFIATDFERMLTARFGGRLEKPLLRVVDGALVTENVPVPESPAAGSGRAERFRRRLATFDLLHRLTRADHVAEAQAVAGSALPYRAVGEAVLAELKRVADARGAQLALVQLPLRNRLAGRPVEVAAWVAGVAGRLGVPFFDLAPALDALPPAERELYYAEDGHFNALGNRLLAGLMLERLRAGVAGFPAD